MSTLTLRIKFAFSNTLWRTSVDVQMKHDDGGDTQMNKNLPMSPQIHALLNKNIERRDIKKYSVRCYQNGRK